MRSVGSSPSYPHHFAPSAPFYHLVAQQLPRFIPHLIALPPSPSPLTQAGNERGWVLKGVSEITLMLDDMGLNLQSMLASPHVRPFADEVRTWEQRLSLISECLEVSGVTRSGDLLTQPMLVYTMSAPIPAHTAK
jgi:hypothetical protein